MSEVEKSFRQPLTCPGKDFSLPKGRPLFSLRLKNPFEMTPVPP
jgi:hypothetical protein